VQSPEFKPQSNKKELCTRTFTAMLFVMAKDFKPPKWSTIEKMIK
jgi:hypothetical protein